MEKKRKNQLNLILKQVFLSLALFILYSTKESGIFPLILIPGYFAATISMLVLFLFPPLPDNKNKGRPQVKNSHLYFLGALGLFLLCLLLFW